MNYILLVDDEEDIRDICEMVLKRSFPLDVVQASSGKKALEVIQERGKPEIIISDLRMPEGDGHFLYQSLKQKDLNIPFVICSTENKDKVKKQFPDLFGFIEKPTIVGPVVDIVNSLFNHSRITPQYIPIRISLLLRGASAPVDLYMKLSDTRYIKVINGGEAFIPEDAQRFYKKDVQDLFMTPDDADHYLKMLEKNLSMVITTESNSQELSVLSYESLAVVERIASVLGWTPEVIETAKHAINLSIKAVSNEPDILKLMRLKLSNPGSNYSAHVSQLALLTCGFCHQLGWVSESTQMKMGLAALMHDLTVDEKVYEDIHLWNQSASDQGEKTPDVMKYRNHPSDAANLLLKMKNVPADVEQIILQHHEMRDGTGFPRGLITSRITPLASIFIIVEDLITYIDDAENIEEKISEFLSLREFKYNGGNFKKVFEAIKASVDNSRH